MVNALNQKIINLSEADIVMLKTSMSNKKKFEQFISQQHKFNPHQIDLLSDKMFEL